MGHSPGICMIPYAGKTGGKAFSSLEYWTQCHSYFMNSFLEYVLYSKDTIFYDSALELLGIMNISRAMVMEAMYKRRAVGSNRWRQNQDPFTQPCRQQRYPQQMEIPQRAKRKKREDGGYHLVTDSISSVHGKYPLGTPKSIGETFKELEMLQQVGMSKTLQCVETSR